MAKQAATETLYEIVFHHNYNKLENVHRPSGHCCPQTLRLLQLFASFLHSFNQFSLGTLCLPEIWPQRPSYASLSPSGYTKMGFKNQENMCSEYRLTKPHYLTQVKSLSGLRQGRLTWRLKSNIMWEFIFQVNLSGLILNLSSKLLACIGK